MAPTDKSIDGQCPQCGRHELFQDIHTDEIKCGNCKTSWTEPEFYGEGDSAVSNEDDVGDRDSGLASLNHD